MKFSTTIVTLLLSALVSSRSLSLFGGQTTLDDDLKVPGDNPLEFCQAPHDDDLFVIKHVNLKPNPPVPGQVLTIEAVGEALVDIEEGAYVILQVKYGLIRIVNTQADFCEQVKNIDKECPIKKGEITVSKDVDIPNEIPPGKYTVLADVYSKDDEHMVCLTAAVVFSRP